VLFKDFEEFSDVGLSFETTKKCGDEAKARGGYNGAVDETNGAEQGCGLEWAEPAQKKAKSNER
jgi:hypothetical protein